MLRDDLGASFVVVAVAARDDEHLLVPSVVFCLDAKTTNIY